MKLKQNAIVSIFCLLATSIASAAVTPVDVNHDGKYDAFLDAANGLLWTDGKALATSGKKFADAQTLVDGATIGGITNWRLPTVKEFQELYATQGHDAQGKMLRPPGSSFLELYYWTSDTHGSSTNSDAFAINFINYSPMTTNLQVRSFADSNLLGVIAVTTVPEPETYTMMLAGLGLLGVAARRRKQKLAL